MATKGLLDYKRTYDPDTEGYGNSSQWREAFFDRMGFAEAEVIIKGQKRTPLEILGLKNGIRYTQDAIKKAFRLKTLELHPDRAWKNGMTIEQATEAFKELTAAYTVLKRV